MFEKPNPKRQKILFWVTITNMVLAICIAVFVVYSLVGLLVSSGTVILTLGNLGRAGVTIFGNLTRILKILGIFIEIRNWNL